MSKLPRVVFFGTDDFSVPALEKLLWAGWPVVGVVTKPDAKSGRGQKKTAPKLKEIAKKAGITVLQPAKPAGSVFKIASLEPHIGVLAAYGKILPQSVIDVFPAGIVNIHPSLLPAWRGASPVEQAILHGDERTGISLMQLTAGMDEGPVYAQKDVLLTGEETGPELKEKLAHMGADFLLQKLPDIVSGSLTPKFQDEISDKEPTYAPLFAKEDGLIDWTKPAEEYERQIRAYLDYPRSTAEIFGKKVVITKARIAKSEKDGDLVMGCGANRPSYLEILGLIGPSGKSMSGADFMRGSQKRA